MDILRELEPVKYRQWFLICKVLSTFLLACETATELNWLLDRCWAVVVSSRRNKNGFFYSLGNKYIEIDV